MNGELATLVSVIRKGIMPQAELANPFDTVTSYPVTRSIGIGNHWTTHVEEPRIAAARMLRSYRKVGQTFRIVRRGRTWFSPARSAGRQFVNINID